MIYVENLSTFVFGCAACYTQWVEIISQATFCCLPFLKIKGLEVEKRPFEIVEILCIQNSVRSKVHENSNTTSERISPNCAVVALYGCSSRSLLSFSRFLHKTEDQYTIWGIEKSFIKQKTRYKRAEVSCLC